MTLRSTETGTDTDTGSGAKLSILGVARLRLRGWNSMRSMPQDKR